MIQVNSLLAHIAIAISSRLNNRTYSPLFEKLGGVEGFFYENESSLDILFKGSNLESLSGKREEWIKKAEEEFNIMEKNNINICYFDDDIFPSLLRLCEDAPLILFYKGNLTPLKDKNLAIVGTRKASERCKARLKKIMEGIVESGNKPNIVSGLAYGIDYASHVNSLDLGLKTQAVLGNPLTTIYPAQHKNIANKILDTGGALISEFPSCCKTNPSNFLQRNRIVAGMCQGTLIAESPIKGGSMATARLAYSYNREVMAIPGRPDDVYSQGCNLLIKQNVSTMVENANDVINALGWERKKEAATPTQTKINFSMHSDDESIILNSLLEKGEQNIDELYLNTKVSINILSASLLKLELENKIIQLPGKKYSLLN